tara:strand:+ start:1570 stop:2205 length:636 start_codon:yes stop_codon:yes gene_type:complete
MLLRLPIEVLIILLPVLLFSLCFHEFAHAYVAYRLGDHTAARNGRLTLSPTAHLDPLGSLMILFVGFGWAKPVPINPYNFKNPRTDSMKVAFAGPASNLFLAFIGGSIIRFLTFNNIFVSEIFIQIIYFFMSVNIALAVFNMLPIEPLDGSRIFGNIIAKDNPQLAIKLQIYGPRILFGLILVGLFTPFSILGMIITPFIKFFIYIFAGLS